MSKKTNLPNPDEWTSLDGMTYQQLKESLGFHELTREACIRGLFGDLFEDLAASRDPESVRVTQAGPGRRNTKRES